MNDILCKGGQGENHMVGTGDTKISFTFLPYVMKRKWGVDSVETQSVLSLTFISSHFCLLVEV